MAIVLSLETSSKNCSVAIHKNSVTLASSEIHVGQSHASKLAPMINQVMKLAEVKYSELSAVAVSSGPGSYTGLRIGVSTAKGLCFSLGVPLIAINTLELMAFQIGKINTGEALLCPMIDARRMEVYCMLKDHNLNIVSPIQARVIDETSFAENLKTDEILFFGDGAMKCKPFIVSDNACFIEDVYPNAIQLGFLAEKKFEYNQIEDLLSFEPFYLKEFMIKVPVGKGKMNETN